MSSATAPTESPTPLQKASTAKSCPSKDASAAIETERTSRQPSSFTAEASISTHGKPGWIQFEDRYSGGFEEFKSKNKKLLKLFIERYWLIDGRAPDVQALTFDAFEANFDLLQQEMAASLNRAGSYKESRNDLTVWFWVADKQRAIIVIPLAKGRLVAQAIETVDPALIKPLLELHAQLSREPLGRSPSGSG